MGHNLALVQDLAVVLVVAGAAAWICQRIGVSVVVGYLLAGILVGPFTPPFSLVTSVESVHSLANLGLIFVLFFIGLGLGLSRLKRLGLAAFVTAGATLIVVLALSRGAVALLGGGLVPSLFLGGILVVSSSAIIDKVLEELDATHEPYAQLALGITIVEDLVAVAMLAILGSIAAASAPTGPSLLAIIAKMLAFVLVLVALGLLVLPRVVGALRRTASREVQTICVAGLLLATAFLAAHLGYSLALGAFLLGSILGTDRYRARLEQTFEPLRDVFAAVFFVSMGMLFDVRLLADAWPLALGLAAFAIFSRAFAAWSGILLCGRPIADAVQVGMSLLPLGEFSFVIAHLGVSSGLMPPSFYPATVGAALVTTLLSPPLMRRSGALARFATAHEPSILKLWRTFIERIQELARQRRAERFVFQHVSRKLMELALEVAVVVSLVACSNILIEQLDRITPWLGREPWLVYAWWALFGIVLLVPLVAIWRNLGVIGMILGEAAPDRTRLKPLIELAVRVFGLFATLLLIATFLPAWAVRPPVLVTLIAIGIVLALLLRGPMIRWYARAQTEVRDHLGETVHAASASSPVPTRPLVAAEGWGLRLHEHTVSDLSPAVGLPLGELPIRTRFNCSVTEIERQGVAVPGPDVSTTLYPGDRLLIVGGETEVDQVARWLDAEAPGARPSSGERIVETLEIPKGAPCIGRSLEELALASSFGVQLLAHARGGFITRIPSATQRLEAGDSVLALATAPAHARFREWLESHED